MGGSNHFLFLHFGAGRWSFIGPDRLAFFPLLKCSNLLYSESMSVMAFHEQAGWVRDTMMSALFPRDAVL